MSTKQPVTLAPLSPAAVTMLAELVERAAANGKDAATLAELYAAAQKAKSELPT